MVEDLRLDSLEGVGPVTTRKLSDAGVHNVMDLIVRGPVEIAEITGMEKDTAEKIVNKARQHLVEGGLIAKDFVSASEIYKIDKVLVKLQLVQIVLTLYLMVVLKHKPLQKYMENLVVVKHNLLIQCL